MRRIVFLGFAWMLVLSMTGCDFGVTLRGDPNGKNLDEAKQLTTDLMKRIQAGEYEAAVGLYSETFFACSNFSRTEFQARLAKNRAWLGAMKSARPMCWKVKRKQMLFASSFALCAIEYEVVYENRTVRESFTLTKRVGSPFRIDGHQIKG